MIKWAIFLAIIGGILGQAAFDECSICQQIYSNSKTQGTETEAQTFQRTLQAGTSFGSQEEQDIYTNETVCHWSKYYQDANSVNAIPANSSCADTGMCPIMYQSPTGFPIVDITNSTTKYSTGCIVPRIILIHHTETNSAQETIDVLIQRGLSVQYIVEKNGTVYKMVNDWNGAWHAGAGQFRNISRVNYNSVGIEIVNNGQEPYPDEQLSGIYKLVALLKSRWYVDDELIIGHYDIAPDRKSDPSGYFPWSGLYDYLKIMPNAFKSSLSADDQKKVIIYNSSWDPEVLDNVQDQLYRWGYSRLAMTTGVLDSNMLMNIQAFNRHFCPELFLKETINATDGETFWSHENMQWYALSQERMDNLFGKITTTDAHLSSVLFSFVVILGYFL